eukprot:CAMPEP_0181488152 /NCGR_PEP_ID=MMETSP1110-20121109/48230_1 /TAXON_ID=174948 /ORGANISM="Symbiodinium sp., Strain CCMP421" /LENGTH=405 /DNA_ID=CAMNT_0023614767 /DNA_START=64 /DNA_END=1277 /DNA_ORIENTATION=-
MAETEDERKPLLEEGKQEKQDDEAFDSMNYDARKLVTFSVFLNFAGTVWLKPSLWKMMGVLMCIAASVSLSVALLVKEPAKLDVAKFSQVSTFLEVVVGLLLGFFLSSSVQRWYDCTNGFLELFDAIRTLHMQLNAFGVPKQRLQMCLRYCVVSAFCLDDDLIASAMEPQERSEFLASRWANHTEEDENAALAGWTDETKSLGKLLPSEQRVLAQIEDPAQTLWVWVTSLLTRLSADGQVPGMATPTYGRIIQIAEQAYGGIRSVRASIRVQPPYVHVQMMAALVLVNNIINAINVGVTSGVTVSICFARLHSTAAHHVGAETVSHSLQDLAVAVILSTVGPFLYQALLEVAVCIAQPFSNASDEKAAGRIPTRKLLRNLEKDLRDIEFMSSHLPWWQQPYFKLP